jgi:hypothetical protein
LAGGKPLAIRIKADPACQFDLSELVSLLKSAANIHHGTNDDSMASLVVSSNCRMKHSLFYKHKVAAVIWIGICDTEIGKTCPSKVFEFTQTPTNAYWPKLITVLARELGKSGQSDTKLRLDINEIL